MNHFRGEKLMQESKYLKGFDEVDKLCEEQDVEGLLSFAFDRMAELVTLMIKTFSKPMSEEEQTEIIDLFMKYSFEYKGKSLEEIGADLCTLLGMFEIINSFTE